MYLADDVEEDQEDPFEDPDVGDPVDAEKEKEEVDPFDEPDDDDEEDSEDPFEDGDEEPDD